MQTCSRALLGAAILLFLLVPEGYGAELRPIAGIAVFGGAEREPAEKAGGIGGIELLGILPLDQRFGLQGSLSSSGGHGFRLGVNAGPVVNLSYGKTGLFVDYEHRAWRDSSFVAIRGAWAAHIDQFDVELSYSHPVSSAQRSGGVSQVGINKLQGLIRFYPTKEVEFNAGLFVNSFAGVDHEKAGGSGVGGIFGLSFKLFDPVVVHLVQAQIDNRERYRVVSGLQIVFGSTLQDWQRSHISSPIGGGTGGIKTSRTRQAAAVAPGILP